MKPSALVVLSGGQDSTTCLFWAKQNYDQVSAITFDYGQRHKIEIDAARKIAEMAKVDSHEIIKLGPILKGKSFLTDIFSEVEQFESYDVMESRNAFKENKLDSSFVPMRNALFLTVAANRAYTLNATDLITGVTSADFAELGNFSWEWLGGFIDAEGCFTKTNTSSYSLQIEQKDPDLIERIAKWILNQVPGVTYSIYLRKEKDVGMSQLTIAKKSFQLIEKFLTPYFHYYWRREQAEKCGVNLSEEALITDEYIVGFWEGDGGCYSDYDPVDCRRFTFSIFQKNRIILDRIQEYLGFGSVGKHNEDIWALRISDGPLSAKFLTRIRPHLCVLGSLKKITKYRHKIDLLAGGFNPPYPDCTPDFIYCMQKELDEALRQPGLEPIEIVTPLMFLSKAETVRLAHSLPQCWPALAHTHTSYDGKYPPTDMNHANVLRAHGFEEACLPDPLVIRAWEEGLMELPETRNYSHDALLNRFTYAK